jgi:hypothetical protein
MVPSSGRYEEMFQRIWQPKGAFRLSALTTCLLYTECSAFFVPQFRMLLYESFCVKHSMVTYARFSTVASLQAFCFLKTLRLLHGINPHTFTLTRTSEKHYCLVILFWDVQNCSYRTVELILDSNNCYRAENWSSFYYLMKVYFFRVVS